MSRMNCLPELQRVAFFDLDAVFGGAAATGEGGCHGCE